jgi:hypothetical protein
VQVEDQNGGRDGDVQQEGPEDELQAGARAAEGVARELGNGGVRDAHGRGEAVRHRSGSRAGGRGAGRLTRRRPNGASMRYTRARPADGRGAWTESSSSRSVARLQDGANYGWAGNHRY